MNIKSVTHCSLYTRFLRQLFTKSTDWFVDKGWKSTQGGFSVVMPVTTDENNMGGFFVRKLAGAASIGVHLQKLWPMLMHPTSAQWIQGHFRPMLTAAVVGNMMICAFYGLYLGDLDAASAGELPRALMALLMFESLVISYYLRTQKVEKPREAIAMPEGKTPDSFLSNIVTRTVAIVSGATAVIALRDLILPGHIIPFLPRDDIYLEWTGAFFHSPPEDSPEAYDQGLQAPLYIGDRFMSQYAALHLLILCLYKFVSAFHVRYGSDGSGEIKCRMIWKSQAVAAALVLFVVRVFQPAAKSASLDMRWHLMCIAYEGFILGVYGFA